MYHIELTLFTAITLIPSRVEYSATQLPHCYHMYLTLTTVMLVLVLRVLVAIA